MTDPICARPLALVNKVDMAHLVDRLIRKGWDKSADAAILQLQKKRNIRGNPTRIKELQTLTTLRDAADKASGSAKASLQSQIDDICARENIKGPALSTIKNQTQKINKALNLVGQKIHGAALPIVKLNIPIAASAGRTRRPTVAEFASLLAAAATIHPLAPLVIRFAVLTALRRERCITIRTSNLIDIGYGEQAIVFQQEKGSKRTGTTPVTTEIKSIIDEALKLHKDQKSNDRQIFDATTEQVEKWFEKSIAATKIKNLRFYDLRHEATSRLFETGLNTAEVMSITGHTTTDMVERTHIMRVH